MKKIARRILSAVLISFLLLIFTGCGAANRPTVLVPDEPEKTPAQQPFSELTSAVIPRHFPNGFTLLGVKLGNMDIPTAKATLETALHRYNLSVTLNGNTGSITGEQLMLSISEKNMASYLDALINQGKTAKLSDFEVVQFNKEALTSALSEIPGANSTAKNAYLLYDSSKSRFVLKKEQPGFGIDMDQLYDAAVEAIQSLESTLTLEIEPAKITPSITSDSQVAKNALKKANGILDLNLKYVYSPASGKSASETLSGASLAKLLSVGSDGLTVLPNDDALVSYATDMKNAHSVVGKKALFKTSTGSSLDLGNSYSSGEYVDTDALIKDIRKCIDNGISGTRTVSYITITLDELAGNFGGSYVEVDLSSQHLWAYKNGQCVASCGTASGCPADGHATPTGLYYINDMDTNCYLVGADYEVFVNYWMGFNGNIGLHDATWRNTFGGTYYYYDGSHGCVNLPLSSAAAIYNNVSVGTPVIVYGGKTSVPLLTIHGTSSYTVATDSAPFKLDAQTDYGLPLKYSTDNASVATVGGDGTVTVKGAGTAHITVATRKYAWCKFTVTITVEKTPCELGNHPWDEGTILTEATCQHTGEILYTCSVCSATKTEIIPLADHTWDGGTETVEATCQHEGEITYTCIVCRATKTETLPMVDHVYDGDLCIWCKRNKFEE